MSKRQEVLAAIKALIESTAYPAPAVGFGGDTAFPATVPREGRVAIFAGEPGDPEIDLSPIAYNWTHTIPVDVVIGPTKSDTADVRLDDLLMRIGDAIGRDRTAFGTCDWIDVSGAAPEDVTIDGAQPLRGAALTITAIYSSDNPLT